MKTYLPKKTNQTSIPSKILFNDNIDYDIKRSIIMRNNHEYTKIKYKKMGIKVLESPDPEFNFNDDLFYIVDLPDGWRIEISDHYWTNVIDNKGRKRISYFSKLVSYDRDAFSNFYTRYSYSIVPFDDYTTSTYEERKFRPWTLYITDGGNRIKKLNQITCTTDDEYYNSDDLLAEEARAYLDQNYPGWEDSDNYWD